MNFFTRVIVLLYITLVLFLSFLMIVFSLHLINFDEFSAFLQLIYEDENLSMLILIIGIGLLVINFAIHRYFTDSINPHRLIAFDNPSGRVSVSLSALEDIVKRHVQKMQEIKDVRLKIRASRRGLRAKIRLILLSEVNIPEITSKVQDLTLQKIQDAIGIEETIRVSVFVGRIIPSKTKEKKSDDSDNKINSNVPFQGYRA